eukprot:1983552-Rhodomonas_salina.1
MGKSQHAISSRSLGRHWELVMASRSSIQVSSNRSLWSHEGWTEGAGTLYSSFPESGSTIATRGRVGPDGGGLSTRRREGPDSHTGSRVMGRRVWSGTQTLCSCSNVVAP